MERADAVVLKPRETAMARRELWTAIALFMIGQRLAMTWRFEMVPPPGLAVGRVAVERERRVDGEVRFKKGQRERED